MPPPLMMWMMMMMMTNDGCRPVEGFFLLFVSLIHYLCSTKFVEMPAPVHSMWLLPPTVASCRVPESGPCPSSFVLLECLIGMYFSACVLGGKKGLSEIIIL